ncbi:MAG: hypothetical protein ACK5VW_06565 [Holosporales bacterium]
MEDKTESESHIRELAHTLFLINGLRTELTSERELLATNSSHLKFLISKFEDLVTGFESERIKTESLIQEMIRKETLRSSKVIAEQASLYLRETTDKQVNDIMKKLSHACDVTHSRIEKSGEKIRYLSRGFFAILFGLTTISGLISSLITHYMISDKGKHSRSSVVTRQYDIPTSPGRVNK